MRKMENINVYIYRVLKQVHPRKEIDLRALNFIDRVLSIYVFNIVNSLKTNGTLCKALKYSLSGDLLKHGLSEMIRVCKNHSASNESTMFSRSISGFNSFDVKMIEYYVIKLGVTNPTNYFLIALTAVIEYLAAEITEISGNKTHDRTVINLSDVVKAINNDQELLKTINRFDFEGKTMYEYVMTFIPSKIETISGVSGVLGKCDNGANGDTFKEVPYNGVDYNRDDQTISESFTLDYNNAIDRLDVDERDITLKSNKAFLNGEIFEDFNYNEDPEEENHIFSWNDDYLFNKKSKKFIFSEEEMIEHDKKVIRDYLNSLENDDDLPRKIRFPKSDEMDI